MNRGRPPDGAEPLELAAMPRPGVIDGGPRLALQPWTTRSVPALLELVLGDRTEIAEREPWRPPSFFTMAGQLERAEQIAHRADLGGCAYYVILSGDEAAGTVGLEFSLDDLDQGQCQLGYWVARRFRGRGVATRAVGMMLTEAASRGLTSVRANVDHDNRASIRVLQKSGLVQSGGPFELGTDLKPGSSAAALSLRFVRALP